MVNGGNGISIEDSEAMVEETGPLLSSNDSRPTQIFDAATKVCAVASPYISLRRL